MLCFVLRAQSGLEFYPLILEGRLQYSTMRNSFTGEKQRGLLCLPAVDYQSSCIWLLPLVLSHAIMWLYGDGPFPRKLHWNILTVTFASLLEEFGPVAAHVRMNSSRSAA